MVRVQVLGKAQRRGGWPSPEDKDVRKKLKHGARVMVSGLHVRFGNIRKGLAEMLVRIFCDVG